MLQLTNHPRLLDTLRRVNHAVLNPLQMRSAGRPGAYASVIRHRGRASGRTYQTPVVAVDTGDGFVIALPYGLRSDWTKNVLAGGVATIVHEGHTYPVDHPEIIPGARGNRFFPAKVQRTHSRFGIENYLSVRRLGRSSGAALTRRSPSAQPSSPRRFGAVPGRG